MTSFESCKRCNRVFEDSLRLGVCKECIEKFGKDREFRAKLSVVRNYIKDREIKGDMLTVRGVAEGTGFPEDEIWMFIRLGEISTASFNDPKVREYKLRAVREREKPSREDADKIAEDIKRITGGYHSRQDK
jgi:hypothetical protein